MTAIISAIAILAGPAFLAIEGITWAVVAMTVASAAYSSYQQRKIESAQRNAAAAAAAAADKAKGFKIASDSEINNTLVVYGRAKLAGGRVRHAIRSTYSYAGPTGGLSFLSSGDPREINPAVRLSTPIVGNAIIVTLHDPNSDGLPPFFASAATTWLSGTVYTHPLVLPGPDYNISRADVGFTTDYTLEAPPGQDNYLFPGVMVTVQHLPMNQNAYWEGTDDAAIVATDFIYEVLTYDSISGHVTLLNPGTLSSTANAGAPALAADDLAGTKREYLFIQQDICIKGIENVYAVDIDERDWRDPVYAESARIHVYPDGNVTDYMAELNGVVSSTATFPETAYASMVFKLDRDEPQYGGIPNVVFYLEGLKVESIVDLGGGNYGLSGTKIYSNNPALCLLDYLRNSKYGLGLTTSQIDLASFYSAARICDKVVQTVPINGKLWLEKNALVPQNREIKTYESNIILDSADNVRTNVNKLLGTMEDSQLIWSDGVYKLRLSYPFEWDATVSYAIGDIVQYPPGAVTQIDLYRCLATPNVGVNPESSLGITWEKGDITNTYPDQELVSLYLNDDDITLDSEISQSWPSSDNKLNFCTVRFLNESKDFEEDSVSWPPKYDILNPVYADYLEQDSNLLLETEIFLEGITTSYQALNAAESRVRLSRNNLVYKLSLTRKFAGVEPGDILQVTSQLLQLTSELLRVLEVEINSVGNVEVVAFRFDARVLAWNAPNNEVITPRSTYSSYIRQATGLQYSSTTPNSASSSGMLTWIDAADSRVIGYKIYYALGPPGAQNANSTWNLIGNSASSSFIIPLMLPGIYTFTVASVTASGAVSPFLDLMTGAQWPRVMADIVGLGAGVSRSSAILFLYKVSPTDITTETPSGGHYDFTTSILTNIPATWYTSIALANAAVPGGGDLYYSQAIIFVDSPVTVVDPISVWTTAALYAANINSRYITAYYREDVGQPIPTIAPTGGSYTFPSGPMIPPIDTDPSLIWSTAPPVGTGQLWETYAYAERVGNYGLNTNTLSWSVPVITGAIGTPGAPGTPGTPAPLFSTVYLYKWSPVQPSIPVSALYTTLYTWATGVHNQLSAQLISDGYSINFPSKPTSPGLLLWVGQQVVSDVAGSVSTVVDWSGNNSFLLSNGVGVIGSQYARASVYQWAPSLPAAPIGISNYVWSINAISSVNAPWRLDQAGGFPGYTLYQASQDLIDASTAVTTTIDWTDKTSIIAIGVYGLQGPAGTGISIEWLGDFTSHPPNPQLNQVYRNITDVPPTIYIYDGQAWVVMVLDGNDGAAGTVGSSVFKSIVFLRSPSQPSLPTGGSYASPIPAGWSDGPQAGTDILWSSSRVFTDTGAPPQALNWTTPVAMTNTASFEVQYSSVISSPGVPPAAGWSTSAGPTTIWMAQRTQINGIWGNWAVTKIKGETGYAVFITYNDTPLGGSVPTPPTNAAGDNNGWHTNATSSVNWMSQKLDDPNNPIGVNWSAAIQISGLNGQAGAPGTAGLSGRIAFCANTLGVANPSWLDIIRQPGDLLPLNSSWIGLNSTWTALPPAPLGVGEYLWQANGFFDAGLNRTVWAPPYISSFKVGSLSALSANLGSITTGQITLDPVSSVRTFGVTQFEDPAAPGFYLGYTGADYVMSLGDVPNNKYMSWNGSSLHVRGEIYGKDYIAPQNPLNNYDYVVGPIPVTAGSPLNSTPGDHTVHTNEPWVKVATLKTARYGTLMVRWWTKMEYLPPAPFAGTIVDEAIITVGGTPLDYAEVQVRVGLGVQYTFQTGTENPDGTYCTVNVYPPTSQFNRTDEITLWIRNHQGGALGSPAYPVQTVLVDLCLKNSFYLSEGYSIP